MIMRKLLYFILLTTLIACQKEEDPLTLDKVRELNTFKIIPFEARVNGSRFSGESVNATKLNKKLSVVAIVGGQSYSISVEELKEGVYLGENNRLKNVISFTNENGVTFTSTKEGESSDAVIEIIRYDAQLKLVSGTMRGTLYAPWNESIKLDEGKFQDILVEAPFLGDMKADVDSKLFDSEQCVHAMDTVNGLVFNTFTSSANCDTLSLTFRLEGGLSERSYNINNQRVTAFYNSNIFSSNIFENQYTSDAGTLTITSINNANKTVRGTFTLTATNFQSQQINITNGNFTALMN